MNKIYNCSGMMSKLGVSRSEKHTIEAVKNALSNFYIMEKLKKSIGKNIAKKLGYEDGIVVNSASAGIVMAIASTKIKKLFDEDKFFNSNTNIVIPQGHLINFNANVSLGIKLANSKINRAGNKKQMTIKHLESKINSKTTAIMVVKSHYTGNYNVPDYSLIYKVAKKNKILFIIDAAAEENFKKYANLADLVIGSGAKYFKGPTSGFVVGKNIHITKIYQIEDTIGRYFKVGKEAILGLEAAIQNPIAKPYKHNLEKIKNLFNLNPKLKCHIALDADRKNIKRIKVKIIKETATKFITYLEKNNIFTRNYTKNENIIYFDFRQIKKSEIKYVIDKVQKW